MLSPSLLQVFINFKDTPKSLAENVLVHVAYTTAHVTADHWRAVENWYQRPNEIIAITGII